MRGNLSPEQLAKLKEAFDNSPPFVPTGDEVLIKDGLPKSNDPGPIGNKFPTSDPGPVYDDDWSRRNRPLPRDGRELPGVRPGWGNLHDGKGYISDFRGAQPSGGQGLQGFGQQAQDPRIQALLQMMQQGGNRPTVGMPDDTLSQAGRFETGR